MARKSQRQSSVQLKIADVFNVRATPNDYTYIDRGSLHADIVGELDQGLIVHLSGPSKSGKSWLAHKVVDANPSVIIESTQLKSSSDFWSEIDTALPNLIDTRIEREFSEKFSNEVEIGKGPIPFGGGTSDEKGERRVSFSEREKRFNTIARAAADQQLIIVVDNFHALPLGSDIRAEIIDQIDLARERNCWILILSVTREGGSALPESKGRLLSRVTTIDIDPWTPKQLISIADKGADYLATSFEPKEVREKMANESLGSPFIMQRLSAMLLTNKDRSGLFIRDRPTEFAIDDVEAAAGQIARGLSIYHPDYDVLTVMAPRAKLPAYSMYGKTMTGTMQQAILEAISGLTLEGWTLHVAPDDIRLRLLEIMDDVKTLDLFDQVIPTLAQMVTRYQEQYRKRIQNVTDYRDPVIAFNSEAPSHVVMPDPFFLFFLRHSQYVRRQLKG